MVLADLGADVIKVEPPEGDATRGYGPPWVGSGADRTAAYFLSVNRNKRSLRLDLRQPEGRDVVRRLIGRSDVLVENFRPGGLDRLGFADDELGRINPRLVHLAITGFGPEGPDANRPGYDFIAQAVGGLMSITGAPDAAGGGPTKVGVAISDIVTGLFGAIGILAALRSGVGQRVDVSLLESTLAVLINQAQNAFVSGKSPGRLGNAHPNIVPYETFRDSRWRDRGRRRQRTPVAPTVLTRSTCPHWQPIPALPITTAAVLNRTQLRPLLADRFSAAPTADWLARLDAAQVPCGPVNDVAAAFAQPQAKLRQMVIGVDHPRLGPTLQVGLPYKLSATPASIRSAPPLLGQDSADILAELGYDEAAISALAASGVT
jgi:crotonobetainyl-CoA:carnitine CoA-transferase CaiB-like acyl-CoA transferase